MFYNLCFCNLLLENEIDQLLAEEDVGENFVRDVILDWVNCDTDAPTFATLTQDDIVDMILRPKEIEISSASSNEGPRITNRYLKHFAILKFTYAINI